MNPQPPVTNMRIEARTSSGNGGAPADFPTIRDQLAAWSTRLAKIDWVPWMIIGLAAFLRLFLLGIKPPHFDEGINGWFVDQMVKNGFYQYDPTNYHGPLHFYVVLLFQTLFGRNVWALRLPVVLVSILCVWLTLKFEPFVGRTTARMAALAMAVSPGFVFYGRYSIHEVWLVLFSLLFILGLLGLWKFGTSNYLWSAGMGLAGMVLTKETYIIHVGCALLAAAGTWLSSWRLTISRRRPKEIVRGVNARWLVPFFLAGIVAGFFLPRPWNRYVSLVAGFCALTAALIPANVILVLYRASDLDDARPAKQTWSYVDLAMVVGVSVAVVVFFYSGTFFNWHGVIDIFNAYTAWFETGHAGHGHEKPFYYWLKLMAPSGHISRADCFGYELPALAGVILCIFCLRFKNVSLRYLAIYGVGALLAYSIVRYKTPWCVINITWPFLFIFGAASLALPAKYGRLTNIVSAILLFASLGSTIWLNYFRCTTDTEPYVYVQTYNDIYKLTNPVLKLARSDRIFYQIKGHIIRTSAYPLPWMLDDFPNVGYYEHDNLPDVLDADFLLVQQDKIEQVEAKLKDSYYTEPLTIRSYQDPSKVYFNAKLFKGFLPGRQPDFIGRAKG